MLKKKDYYVCVILITRILWPRFPSFLCKRDYKCISRLFSIILILVTERTNSGVSWGVTDTQKNSLKHARYKGLQKSSTSGSFHASKRRFDIVSSVCAIKWVR